MWYYPISRNELLGAIGRAWRKKAVRKTRENRRRRMLFHDEGMWSDIKQVYLEKQNYKCVFCEMKILVRGKANSDVEHFRPKGKIAGWPAAKSPQYPFSTGGSQATGYYWLAYDPFNYAASCKHCNSALKRFTFPILGARGAPHASIARLNALEQPLLLFPFGPWGDNPADYFEFNGVLMVPKETLGTMARRRAEATIRFFDLNDSKYILFERHSKVVVIYELYQALFGDTGTHSGNGGLALASELHEGRSQAFFAYRYFSLLKSTDQAMRSRAKNDYILSAAFLNSMGINSVVP